MHRIEAFFVVNLWVRWPSFRVQFFPSPLLPCAAPSTIEGEDRSFLRPRRTPLNFPPPITLSFVAFASAIATIRNFLDYRCHPKLPPLLLPAASFAIAVVAVTII
ncbi:hypothetical protein BHE74_00055202 [Ensete ventricosum]|nr:hypothetical protein GW17_00055844 [Ensete ventricosum]RWW39470.1 hypothetical protein BHE74_00055202 [Ensete ventricosum]RZS18665.1 hypothetical protein BHM03_00050980 [Ensete ventricosum]